MNSKGSQPYIYMYLFSSKLPSHSGCHMTLSRVHCAIHRTLVFIHPVYNSLHLLTANSQSFPPSLPSPLAITSLFSMSVSLFLFHREAHLYYILDSTYRWYICYLSFSFWLTSFSMIISRSISVAANGIISFFLWLSSIPLYIYTTSLSIPLLMDI